MNRHQIEAFVIFGATLILFLMISIISGCKSENPLTKVTLRQPYIEQQSCALWKYKDGTWKLEKIAEFSECDLVFGLNWGDFDYLRRYYEEFAQKCK